MSNIESSEPTVAEPVRQKSRKVSAVWLVPIVALFIGGWLAYKEIADKGPTIQISFETAIGVAKDKTAIRCKEVNVGIVTSVKLTEDLQGVIVEAELNKDARRYLTAETRFWVVRPRVGAGGVTGLNTLLSWGYIGVEPVLGDHFTSSFVGLEEPPALRVNAPGLHLVLRSETATSLHPGAGVFYRGFEVGKVGRRRFGKNYKGVEFDVYIEPEYEDIVSTSTKFWNASGIDIKADANGISLRTEALETMLTGGVTFGYPDGSEIGEPVSDGMVFQLYRGIDETEERQFVRTLEFVVFFEGSVGGLQPKAPVTFKGIPIGMVKDVSLRYDFESKRIHAPAIIAIEPRMLMGGKSGLSEKEFMDSLVANGVRAQLKSSNLLTGQMGVNFQHFDDVEEATIDWDYSLGPIMPGKQGSIDQLVDSAGDVLKKFEALNLEETLESVSQLTKKGEAAVSELEATLASARAVIEEPSVKQMPDNINRTMASLQQTLKGLSPDAPVYRELTVTLEELRAAAASIKTLADTIEEKPNSLIFGKKKEKKPSSSSTRRPRPIPSTHRRP